MAHCGFGEDESQSVFRILRSARTVCVEALEAERTHSFNERRTDRHFYRPHRHGLRARSVRAAPRQDPRIEAGYDAGVTHRKDSTRTSLRKAVPDAPRR